VSIAAAPRSRGLSWAVSAEAIAVVPPVFATGLGLGLLLGSRQMDGITHHVLMIIGMTFAMMSIFAIPVCRALAAATLWWHAHAAGSGRAARFSRRVEPRRVRSEAGSRRRGNTDQPRCSGCGHCRLLCGEPDRASAGPADRRLSNDEMALTAMQPTMASLVFITGLLWVERVAHRPSLPSGNCALTAAAAGARLIQRGWIASRLLTPSPPLPMHSKCFTGSSTASIDVFGARVQATRCGGGCASSASGMRRWGPRRYALRPRTSTPGSTPARLPRTRRQDVVVKPLPGRLDGPPDALSACLFGMTSNAMPVRKPTFAVGWACHRGSDQGRSWRGAVLGRHWLQGSAPASSEGREENIGQPSDA
jgi:hypothetical protein